MKGNLLSISIITSLIFLVCAFFSPVQAQEAAQSIDLSIQSIPIKPSPGETVLLEAVSYSIDLDQATLSWTYGGKTVASSVGNTRISVVAPKSGVTATASVTVSAPGIAKTTASIVLTPGSVDLLWEGVEAAHPPFYKGRSLVAPGGLFRVVAIPAAGAPKNVSVDWSRKGSALALASGAGKESLVLEHSMFNKVEDIAATVHGGLFEGNGSVAITPRAPLAAVYQKKEGFIDYANGSKGTVSISGPGTTLRIEPFFFSIPKGLESDLVFDMNIGDSPVYGEKVPNEIRLSRPEEEDERTLSLSITTTSYSLQSFKRAFTLLFQ